MFNKQHYEKGREEGTVPLTYSVCHATCLFDMVMYYISYVRHTVLMYIHTITVFSILLLHCGSVNQPLLHHQYILHSIYTIMNGYTFLNTYAHAHTHF